MWTDVHTDTVGLQERSHPRRVCLASTTPGRRLIDAAEPPAGLRAPRIGLTWGGQKIECADRGQHRRRQSLQFLDNCVFIQETRVQITLEKRGVFDYRQEEIDVVADAVHAHIP